MFLQLAATASAFVSTLAFTYSGVPQMLLCIRQGHAHGLATGTVWAWILGEGFGLLYAALVTYMGLMAFIAALPLFVNYAFNLACLSIVIKIKYFPKEK